MRSEYWPASIKNHYWSIVRIFLGVDSSFRCFVVNLGKNNLFNDPFETHIIVITERYRNLLEGIEETFNIIRWLIF